VKLLQRVDARGLELWQPAFKAAFPLPVESIALLFRDWGVAAPATIRRAASIETFLRDVVAPHADLSEVRVAKDRMASEIDGCIVEIADLMFDDEPIRTIAVEHADPARVWRTVEQLGFSRRPNVNYVKALKQFLSAHANLKHRMRLEAQS
jgi:exopolyphosphatase/guanosine-5'-triphosphate,3'-diphosphate pyrophosphatase